MAKFLRHFAQYVGILDIRGLTFAWHLISLETVYEQVLHAHIRTGICLLKSSIEEYLKYLVLILTRKRKEGVVDYSEGM